MEQKKRNPHHLERITCVGEACIGWIIILLYALIFIASPINKASTIT